MKKIYVFFAVALMSASLFAAPTKVPTVADLNAVGDLASDVVLCLYFDEEVCNDIVLAGTYNSWNTTPAEMTKFEKLAGFDGWYVASCPFVDGVDKDNKPNTQGKPVQLKSDGSFDWKYQSGDAAAWIHKGGNEMKVTGGYDGEADIAYEAAGAYIYEIAYWKLHNSPCEYVPKHVYTLVMFDPWCEENPEFVPAVAGEFNNWTLEAMNASTYQGEEAWIMTIETEEGNQYKFAEYTQGWKNEFSWYDPENDGWKGFGNFSFPVATKDTTIVYDWSETNNTDAQGLPQEAYKYNRCGMPTYDDVTELSLIVKFIAPAGAPEVGVELMGDFADGAWDTGIMMELVDGVYTAPLKATEAKQFKFREAGNWDNTVIYANGKEIEGNFYVGKYINEDKTEVNIDLSSAEYAWAANVEEEGIENIVLTEKARKVVVDGVLYIVRDNKMFNVQGAQVR